MRAAIGGKRKLDADPLEIPLALDLVHALERQAGARTGYQRGQGFVNGVIPPQEDPLVTIDRLARFHLVELSRLAVDFLYQRRLVGTFNRQQRLIPFLCFRL